jgi:hypothetical protein
MNTYTWEIEKLRTLNVGNQNNYVVFADYSITATDGTYSVIYRNTCEFEVKENDSDFVAYNDLTKNMIIGWINQEEGISFINEIYVNLDRKIEAKKNPPQRPTSQPLPF